MVIRNDITVIMSECWQTAEDHGWHDVDEMKKQKINKLLEMIGTEHSITEATQLLAELIPSRTIAEEIALLHSEASEALEEHRNGKPLLYHEGFDSEEQELTSVKPEGIASEYADILIRIFDTCTDRNIPLLEALHWKMAYNKTRPYRHGGKKL